MANDPNTLLNRQPRPKLKRISGTAMLVRGLILTFVGIVLSIASYSCASDVANSGGTGHYVIFYGMVIGGIIYTIVGLFRTLMGK